MADSSEPKQDEPEVHHPLHDGRRTEHDESGESTEQTGPSATEDTGGVLEAVGEAGIYLGYAALLCAVAGIIAGFFVIQPLANVLFFFSLVFVTLSMIVGVIFRAFGSDRPFLFRGS